MEICRRKIEKWTVDEHNLVSINAPSASHDQICGSFIRSGSAI